MSIKSLYPKEQLPVFAERLRIRRKAMGLTSKELQERCKIGRINNYEQGKVFPKAQALEDLAKQLKTTVEWLVGSTNDETGVEPLPEYRSAIRIRIEKIMEHYQLSAKETANIFNTSGPWFSHIICDRHPPGPSFLGALEAVEQCMAIGLPLNPKQTETITERVMLERIAELEKKTAVLELKLEVLTKVLLK